MTRNKEATAGYFIPATRMAIASLRKDSLENLGRAWEIIGHNNYDWRLGSLRPYDLEFEPLLQSMGFDSIGEWAKGRIVQKMPINFLDLFGPAETDYDRIFTTRTAVTLDKPTDPSNIYVILGDFFLSKTQNTMRDRAHSIGFYDLVIYRPIAAARHVMPQFRKSQEKGTIGLLNVFRLSMERIYALMSKNDSVFLATFFHPIFPRSNANTGQINFFYKSINNWLEIQRNRGIDLVTNQSPIDGRQILMLQKHTQSPETLTLE